jgi:Fe-S-cluster containining protein
VAAKRNPWYVCGLQFECAGCGGCCAGPGEGYIWVSRHEITLIAKHLGISEQELKQKYLRRVGWRTSIIEQAATKDCIFLQKGPQGRGCAIYKVRPNQCRTWPFWKMNLANPDSWNGAAQKCPGMNLGRSYDASEIERLRDQEKWWDDE